jgi:O-antigen/teichoic acid export membrane protein
VGTETPLAYRVVRGGLWVAASSYWTIGCGFIATLWITRLLEPEAFGIFALATFFAQLVRLQPKLGLGYAFAQRKDATDLELSTYLIMDTLAAVGGLLLALLAALVLPSLGYSHLVAQVAVILSLGAMLETFTGIGAMLLEKELHFSQTSIVQSIAFPISYGPAIWLAMNGGGVWSLVAQNLLYNLIFLLGVWWVIGRRMTQLRHIQWRFSIALARQFVRFGITIGVGMMAGMLLTQLDNLLVGTFASVAILGFYDRAYRTAQWPSTMLTGLIARTSFYTFTKLQDDVARLGKTVTMLLWLVTSFSVPLALVVFVTAPDLLLLLYGERWLPSALFLRFLVIYAVVRPIWDSIGSLFVAIGKPELTTKVCVAQLVGLAVIGLPLTLIWGATGTCVAVGLAFILGGLLIYRNLRRETSIVIEKALEIPALACLITILGYLTINRFTGINELDVVVRVVIKSAFALGMFYGLIFLTQPAVTKERVKYFWRLAFSPSP